MKKVIGILILVLLVQILAVAQTSDTLVIGIWLGEYEGYDPQTQSNLSVRRRLIFQEENKVYIDTLWGQPSGSDDIVLEMEIGNWEINIAEDSVVFTPTISKRIDISDPDSLVEYDRGIHKKELSSMREYEWEFHDDNLDVDYVMNKEEFIDTPGTPEGNTAPFIYEECTYTTSGATSNLNHDLEYSFDWDDGTSPDWSSDTSASHSWDTAGIKIVTVTARCELHPDRTATSDTLYVDVQDETISKPGTPEGNTAPFIYEECIYTTSGAASNINHDLEYSFDWDDGTCSDWSSDTSASHIWTTTGIKIVTVTARCGLHHDKTGTSDTLYVDVQDETISKPGTPEGETSPVIDEEYNYTTSGATSNVGHTVEYSFDWGDGTSSEWSTSNSASHSWSTEGLKYVAVTAHCQTHLNKVNTSDSLEVNVETVTGINKTSNTYSFNLLQDYPMTLNGHVTISYHIPEHTSVIISVYNIKGQLVKSLVNSTQSSGYYKLFWDGTDENGNNVNSGIYLFSFKTKDYYRIQKSTFIR